MLTELGLAENAISDEGAVALRDAICLGCSLQKLDLSFCYSLTSLPESEL